MPLIGLIGYPLGHTFSPAYFNEKFKLLGMSDWHYEAFPLETIRHLPDLLEQHPDMVAFNVTLPYKLSVLNYCHELDDAVNAIGAANLITISRQGEMNRLKAYNTDYIGFSITLKHLLDRTADRALVLGTGGSSAAIRHALENLSIPYDSVGRKSVPSYNEIDLSGYDLIVNCTPVGMAPVEFHSDKLNLNYDSVRSGTLYYDLVYNPQETVMMKLFKARGARVTNGLDMLHEQAEAGWNIISSRA